jgi:dienelactone hydrolase
MKKLGGYILISLALAMAAGIGGAYWYYRDAIDIHERSFSEMRELLEPHFTWYLPDSDAAAPAIVFFHGCGGLHEPTLKQARAAAGQGYVALVVDSHTPRNIDWNMNCDGRVLWGQERAADVLVAVAVAREHAAVDSGNLFLLGYSHGAWTALEALALGSELPPGLLDRPADPLRGVRGLVAWYPYCGGGASFVGDWQPAVPVLMLLAEEDVITAPEPCAEAAATQAGKGYDIRELTYPGVSHGFDRDEDWVKLYDPDIARQAIAEQFEFLQHRRG